MSTTPTRQRASSPTRQPINPLASPQDEKNQLRANNEKLASILYSHREHKARAEQLAAELEELRQRHANELAQVNEQHQISILQKIDELKELKSNLLGQIDKLRSSNKVISIRSLILDFKSKNVVIFLLLFKKSNTIMKEFCV